MLYEIFQQINLSQIKETAKLHDVGTKYEVLLKRRGLSPLPPLTAALILHDVGTKNERKHWIEEFKEGRIDLLLPSQSKNRQRD